MGGLSGHTSGTAVTAVTITTTAVAALAVFTRLITRIWIVREPGLDDGFISAALLFSIATTVTMCLQVRWGMSQHMLPLLTTDPTEIIKNQKAFYISIWVYNLSLSCTKFSILLQYLRIFPQRAFRIACYVLIVVISIYTSWTFFSAVFACWPIPYFWDPVAHPGGRCLDRFAVWFANTGMNIVTDITIGILPLPVLKELQLPKRQKIALMIVFGLGGCTCVVSILRLQSLYVISEAKDITWYNPLAAIWSSVEINTAMLCSCLPTLCGLVLRFCPTVLTPTPKDHSVDEPKLQKNSGDTSTSTQTTTVQQHSGSLGQQARKSLEALGRGFSGFGDARGKSNFGGRDRDSTSEEFEFDEREAMARNGDLGRIQVVTVMEQDVRSIKKGGDRGEGNL